MEKPKTLLDEFHSYSSIELSTNTKFVKKIANG